METDPKKLTLVQENLKNLTDSPKDKAKTAPNWGDATPPHSVDTSILCCHTRF